MEPCRHILIVDDEALNRELLEDMLDSLGHVHVTAASGMEALARLTPGTDLILLDVMMPHMDGFEVLERIRQDAPYCDLPVIMVTELNSKEDRLRAVDAGANDFIVKPVDKTELKVRTASCLKMKEAQDRIKRYQAELEAIVEQRTSELRDALEFLADAHRKSYENCLDTIRRLALASEYKDARTGLHLERVSHYCALLGRVAKLPERDVEILFQASAMHDVGKLGIPDNILSKAGVLTAEERETMKQHTTIGGGILGASDSELLQAGEVIAITHHEMWDGSGYPCGLSGENIPLFGRICAIADVFDALTSQRSYKDAFENSCAYQILRDGRGTHFDPCLVDLFFEHLDEVEAIQRQFPE